MNFFKKLFDRNKIFIYLKTLKSEGLYKATTDSVGWDISVPDNFSIEKKGFYLLDTEIVIDFSNVSQSVAMLLLPRSVGLFERDYCGQEDTVKMALMNTSNKEVKFKKGERIGQIFFVKTFAPKKIINKHSLENKNDYRGGLGSSGGYK